ncbi:MAG TPA: Ig-like domain-containing protein, partial [Gemmatimonadaceae bacterium]|nr:Ig-like domain-containing protein [Gemmatimonadaceae bacterium]
MRHHRLSGATAMVAIASLSFVAAACGGIDGSGLAGVPATPTEGAPVALSRNADTLLVDQSLSLTAILPANAGAAVAPAWSSSDATVATVSQSGLVFALKSGRATITVTSRGASASTTIVVKPSIRVIQFDTDTLALGLSQSAQLTYRAIDSDGNAVDLSTHVVEWTSSAPQIAAVTSAATITGKALGAADVRLTVDGKASMVRVQVKPQTVASVTISPSPLSVAVGHVAQLTATVKDASGNTLTNRSVAWSTNNAAVVVVSSTGALTPISAGTAKITAVSENKRAAATITVTPPVTAADSTPAAPTPAPVASITATLGSSTLTVGQSTQASAVLKDDASNVLTGRTVSWTTSDATVATVSADGLVTAIKAGSAAITATAEGKSGSATVSVSAPVLVPRSISVTTNAPTLRIGEMTQATAVVKDANGTVMPNVTVTWSSAPTSVVTISSNGLALAKGVGTGSVSASASGVTGSATLTVVDTATAGGGSTPSVPAGPTVTLKAGQSIQSAVNANPAGTVFVLTPGTYLNQRIVPKKGNVFYGQPGAVLDGANTTAYAFDIGGSPYPDSVRIHGLTITRYMPEPYQGAIRATPGGRGVGPRGWVVDSNEVSYNKTEALLAPMYGRVTGNYIHHNGQEGIGGNPDGVLIDNNEVAFNNYEKLYSMGDEAGGIKLAVGTGNTVRNNYVHDNWGAGIWFDIDMSQSLVEGNRVENNADAGIFYEI